MSESALVGAIGKRIIKISLNMSFVQKAIQSVLVHNFFIRKGETPNESFSDAFEP